MECLIFMSLVGAVITLSLYALDKTQQVEESRTKLRTLQADERQFIERTLSELRRRAWQELRQARANWNSRERND